MYILDEEGKDLLATVKEFCEKEEIGRAHV